MSPPGSTGRLPHRAPRQVLVWGTVLGFCLGQTGCLAPVGARKVAPAVAYRQTHKNAVNRARPSHETRSVLCRFDQEERFRDAPEVTLELIHQKALENGEHDLLLALSELSYLAGERLRRSVKPWETRDARDYYLASAVYAWLFLFGEETNRTAQAFDPRVRAACDFYNYGLGWALTRHCRSTDPMAVLEGGTRSLPVGRIDVEFSQPGFVWPLAEFERFVIADQFLVRGLSVRNRQAGLGTPLVGVCKQNSRRESPLTVPATVLLRVEGGLSDLRRSDCRAALELYSTFDAVEARVGDRTVPLEADRTVSLAYALNDSFVWRLGRLQFRSAEERIPTAVYRSQPYQPGRVPVVFVHGTFSSPVRWAEMVNTLIGDAELREHYQFWYFIYNSGNPTPYSAVKLRESLAATLQELDPEGKDPALRQIVLVGHSQGGLLTKLTVTDSDDRLVSAVFRTHRLNDLGLPAEREALVRRYLCYEALPFVKRVVFISTPHRGSYLARGLARKLARAFVSLPAILVNRSLEFVGVAESLDVPRELRVAAPTSLDSMSPKNPWLLALAGLPLAPGVKGHSIIAVKGDGEPQGGKDGVVAYESAHVDYVESELIVRSPHSCQNEPPTIEEVRRILREHLVSIAVALGG